MGAIVVHRLLKNEVVERTGMSAYALISQDCISASDIDPAALGMGEHTETYDRIGDVPGWAHDLERRWQDEEARGNMLIAANLAIQPTSSAAIGIAPLRPSPMDPKTRRGRASAASC